MDDREFKEQVTDFAKSEVCPRLFERLDAYYVQVWKNTTSAQGREMAYFLIKAAEQLKQDITLIADDERIREFNRRLKNANN